MENLVPRKKSKGNFRRLSRNLFLILMHFKFGNVKKLQWVILKSPLTKAKHTSRET